MGGVEAMVALLVLAWKCREDRAGFGPPCWPSVGLAVTCKCTYLVLSAHHQCPHNGQAFHQCEQARPCTLHESGSIRPGLAWWTPTRYWMPSWRVWLARSTELDMGTLQ